MGLSFRQQLKELKDQVDAMVDALLQCNDEDLTRTIETDFEGRTFRTNLRAATRYTIEEYRVHEGQIGGNQFNTEMLRSGKSKGDIVALTPYDRKEAAWLSAELYVAAASLIARCLGYPEEMVDEHPKEGEWSVRETIEHMIHMEKSGEWSLQQLVERVRGGTAS
ncbi:MAG: hypothetical protein GTN74_03620 [Proteobacteria bacterium]|nr:hypothetical protein [Pseudomonadota bacterium]NIS68380.1 hypothetical protein [Pseudomonadota bacterium]